MCVGSWIVKFIYSQIQNFNPLNLNCEPKYRSLLTFPVVEQCLGKHSVRGSISPVLHILLISNERGQTNLPVFSNCSQSVSQCRRKINTVTWILTVSVHRKIYYLSS